MKMFSKTQLTSESRGSHRPFARDLCLVLAAATFTIAGSLDAAAVGKGQRQSSIVGHQSDNDAIMRELASHAQKKGAKEAAKLGTYFVGHIADHALVVCQADQTRPMSDDFFTEASRLVCLLRKTPRAWKLEYMYTEPNEGVIGKEGMLWDLKPFFDRAWAGLLRQCQASMSRGRSELYFPLLGRRLTDRYVAFYLKNGREARTPLSERQVSPGRDGVARWKGYKLDLVAPKSYR
jgi:hypothetical protein